MARSRYSETPIIDKHHFGTTSLPVLAKGLREIDLLDGIRTFEYVIKRGDRIDQLASKFFNESEYWWVLSLTNGINYPFASGGFTPGRAIRVPFDVNDVFARIFSK